MSIWHCLHLLLLLLAGVAAAFDVLSAAGFLFFMNSLANVLHLLVLLQALLDYC